MTPISKETTRALKAMEDFDPQDYVSTIILTTPLDSIFPGKQLDQVLKQMVENEELRLHAEYISSMKKDMAKAEEEMCWQKV